ncbi:unnamed protein product [Cylicocyclus nassatus]|uniref:7TM GPCR serpentine receptor class x (Srx) domain-containing protein n=1 Tax=Cylicocyclus nassatus TaxID=53992 RepID=A0AA36HDE1_CYLNA|nr:unnamed protein product [Cylicocyclus nassatus]
MNVTNSTNLPLINYAEAALIVSTSLARKGCTAFESEEMRRHHKKEVNLFVQAFMTSVVHSLILLSFNLTSIYVSEGIFLFLGTTFVWELSYAFAGCVLIWFNPEIQRHLGLRASIRLLFNNTTSRMFQMTSSRN